MHIFLKSDVTKENSYKKWHGTQNKMRYVWHSINFWDPCKALQYIKCLSVAQKYNTPLIRTYLLLCKSGFAKHFFVYADFYSSKHFPLCWALSCSSKHFSATFRLWSKQLSSVLSFSLCTARNIAASGCICFLGSCESVSVRFASLMRFSVLNNAVFCAKASVSKWERG